ncbi:hypothetical protein BCF44_14038 [Kutzneria buriramensis]|uniref:Uncharacterized protein n=1 Tax=Kutzneria buriramensis TaxID=1045776 RepID=A0A3E0G5T9_9PSEU|nr:hypothetical protein BCF44_14038 [Kutzneria buriramensis]
MSGTTSRYSNIRSNRATDDRSSTDTCKSWPIGKYRRVCSVVNATTVPAETSVPFASSRPAIRYTAAGVIDRNACTIAKKPWPIICWRTSRSASRWFSPW